MNAKNKPNGHGALQVRSRGANGGAMSMSGMGGAASDDASELSVANATAVSAAAGAEREAYADVAPAEGGGEQFVIEKAHAASQSLSEKDGEKEKEETGVANSPRPIPPGSEALPIDGEAFVDAVHSRVDLVLLEERLLNSKDEKVAQRELAYLRELRYGKHGPASEDGPPQIIVDIPGPERDTP